MLLVIDIFFFFNTFTRGCLTVIVDFLKNVFSSGYKTVTVHIFFSFLFLNVFTGSRMTVTGVNFFLFKCF